MKKAVKAFTIGDKLYNMERIHSKLIHLYSQVGDTANNKERANINIAVERLLEMIDCFGTDLNSIVVNNYRQSISQTKFLLDTDLEINKEDVFKSFCFMHGCFVKFRLFIKGILKKGCERHYQEVCLPILQIELDKKTKAHNK